MMNSLIAIPNGPFLFIRKLCLTLVFIEKQKSSSDFPILSNYIPYNRLELTTKYRDAIFLGKLFDLLMIGCERVFTFIESPYALDFGARQLSLDNDIQTFTILASWEVYSAGLLNFLSA
jgi:hypothetical protein